MAGVAIGVSPIGQILHHESGSKPPWLRGVTLLPLPHFRPPSGAESGPLASERDTPIATPPIGIGSAGVTGCPQRRVPFDAFGAFVREVVVLRGAALRDLGGELACPQGRREENALD